MTDRKKMPADGGGVGKGKPDADLDHGSPDDDGFADYQARKDDDTPDTNWDMDDYRRTDFAGSRDGTNHPHNPPDIDGEPPLRKVAKPKRTLTG